MKKKRAESETNSPQQLSFNASSVSENNVLTRDIKLNDIEDETADEHVTTTPVKEPQKIYAREVIITTETNKQNEVQVKPRTKHCYLILYLNRR